MRRKLSLALAILLLVGGVAFAATPGYRSDPGIGDIRGQGKLQSDPHKTFRMVRYGGVSVLPADSLVIWDFSADDGVTITTTTVSNSSAVAGIIVQQALSPDALATSASDDRGGPNWTWLQTYGKSQVDITGNVTAGDAMGTGITAGEAGAYVADTSTSGENGNAGFFYDTGTIGDANVECFVRTE